MPITWSRIPVCRDLSLPMANPKVGAGSSLLASTSVLTGKEGPEKSKKQEVARIQFETCSAKLNNELNGNVV